jgi:NADPH:quinone reductase
MKAIVINTFGGPEVLTLTDLPIPVPGPNEVLVKNMAIGVNFVDTQHRAGEPYPVTLPLVPGVESAGIVEAIGSQVTEFKVGQPVGNVGHMGGIYAQYSLIPESRLIPLPPSLDFTIAAASLMQAMTAHALTESVYVPQAGEYVLIQASAGGVGLFLIQMAKRRGAIVIGTASSAAKVQLAQQAGADHVIQYTQTDFEAETLRLTNGQGVSVIYDSVGKTTFDKNINVLKAKGHLVIFGLTSGNIPPFDINRLSGITGTGNKGSLTLTWPTLNDYAASREDQLWRARDVFAWTLAGQLRPYITETLPLAQASRAHQILETRNSGGKIILLPW